MTDLDTVLEAAEKVIYSRYERRGSQRDTLDDLKRRRDHAEKTYQDCLKEDMLYRKEVRDAERYLKELVIGTST